MQRKWTGAALPAAALIVALAAAAWLGRAEAAPPSLEPVECWFKVPNGHAADCYRLTVLESRTRPDGPTLKLPVVVLKTPAATHHPDPIIHLSGGPGYGAWLDKDRISYWWELIDDSPWLQERDLILFDQRGTGLAQPLLGCEELKALAPKLLQLGNDGTARRDAVATAVRACRDRVTKAGHDLLAYNSATSAADLAELRRALGVARWNVYGLSYGTRLALTLMRDHPEGIRSAILDSVYPPEVQAFEESPAAAVRAFKTLFEGCAADPRCDASYPDLERVFLAVVRYLDEHPVKLTRRSSTSDQPVPVVLTGDLLIEDAFDALYTRDDIEGLPRLIYELADGKTAALESVADDLVFLYLDTEDLGEAMTFSVECFEEYPFNDAKHVAAEIDRFPSYRSLTSTDDTYVGCPEWRIGTPPPIENQPVVSEIPTLVLAGAYDPVTPPAWARLAASRLPNGFLFEFPGAGHDVLGTESCAGDLAAAFLDRPETMPTAACLGEQRGPDFDQPEEGTEKGQKRTSG